MQTSAFGADFTAPENNVKESVMIWYHLRSMEIKVYKPTHVFEENMSVVFKAKNTGVTTKNKTVALSYHFVREHVANNAVKVMKIHTSDNFSYPFTKPPVKNDFHGFYNDCMVNG